MSDASWVLRDTSRGTERELESRSEAEDAKQDLLGIGADAEDLEIVPPGGEETVADESGEAVEATPEPVDANTEPVPDAPTDEGALADLGESINDDPLDILPSYMITTVDGDPTVNKRGVSVLAFHFDVEVVDHEVVVYPHETDYETCVMRFVVKRDGKEYVGHGEAHVDEMEKTRLVRMAETRAYKRAVIFATGTGIVGYQEIMSEL